MTVVALRVRCPKCRDGVFQTMPCPYCAGEVFVEAKFAKALRETSREVHAIWCECTELSAEVMIGRGGIFCVVCEKQVQEEWGNSA